VSAEFYDDFIDDQGRHHGQVLRRLALLGADPPRVKSLADLPFARFGEPTALADPRPFSVVVFSEVPAVDRAAAIAAITAGCPGVPQSVLDALPDEQLTAWAQSLAAAAPPVSGTANADNPAGNQAQPGATCTDSAAKPADELAKVQQFAERTLARLTAAERRLAAHEKTLAANHAAGKKQRVEQFCERLVREGRVSPGELDDAPADPKAGRPHAVPGLKSRLLRADDTSPVQKFAEPGGREVALTEFDLQCRELEARPVLHRFAEQLAQPREGGNGPMTDERRRRLLQGDAIGRAVLRREEQQARKAS
jgi:hypothetical protein